MTDPETANANMGIPGSFRAPIVTKSTLSEFNINGHWNTGNYSTESTVTYSVTEKGWMTDLQWPLDVISEETPVKFYAYASVNKNDTQFLYNANNVNRPPYNPFLYFMVDENAEEQKDLLVATQTARPIDNKVHFHFTHPCAALQFAICKTKALTNFSIQVESVILHNIYSSGFYYFDTDSWEVDTEEQPSYFTLLEYPSNSQGMRVNTEGSSTDRTNNTFLGNGDDDYMFFIPQTITGWSGGSVANTDGAYIEIRCSITKGSKNYAEDGAVYIPFSAVLEKGFIHRFNIRMGTSLRNAEGLTINFRDQ